MKLLSILCCFGSSSDADTMKRKANDDTHLVEMEGGAKKKNRKIDEKIELGK